MKKSIPYRCPVCARDPETYYGRLIFPEDEPPFFCPNHKAKIRLVPVVDRDVPTS